VRSVEKHFRDSGVEQQVPPLRYAPVGMTILFAVFHPLGWAERPMTSSVEKHFHERSAKPQIPRLRSG
jgi:hypothetical protein